MLWTEVARLSGVDCIVNNNKYVLDNIIFGMNILLDYPSMFVFLFIEIINNSIYVMVKSEI